MMERRRTRRTTPALERIGHGKMLGRSQALIPEGTLVELGDAVEMVVEGKVVNVHPLMWQGRNYFLPENELETSQAA